MVRAEEFRTTIMGQEGRDRTRCDAMELLGWDIFTADNKHSEIQRRKERVPHKKSTKLIELLTDLPKHCDTNFAIPRFFFTNLRSRFGATIRVQLIVVDYFFCPAGYVEVRWLEKFFEETLCGLVEENLLEQGCCVWLPHLDHTNKMIEKYRDMLETFFVVNYVSDPNMNPLYYATGLEQVNNRLLQFPEAIINSNQILRLDAKAPFISLASKGIPTSLDYSVACYEEGSSSTQQQFLKAPRSSAFKKQRKEEKARD